jgi:stage VI sporulation protein D
VETQFHQLRFDISEKVRLHPQQPGIDAMLELDLYPDVEIREEGQHLKIQGYLRLSGEYQSNREEAVGEGEADAEDTAGLFEAEEAKHELAYVIPVEITLPAEKADREMISAEVEGFDYQVLSPFELKVEAILVIDGLLPEREETHPDRLEDAEEVPLFTGYPAEPDHFGVSGDESGYARDEERWEETKRERYEPAVAPYLRVEDESSAHMDEGREWNAWQAEPEYDNGEDIHRFDDWSEQSSDYPAGGGEPNRHEREALTEGEPGRPERELADEPRERREDPQFQKQVRSAHERDVEENGEVPEAGEKPAGKEWIRWLLGNKEENFSAMRMVIVQEEENIEQLAEKYEVSSGQIERANGLKSDSLETGQILHVPVPSQQKKT